MWKEATRRPIPSRNQSKHAAFAVLTFALSLAGCEHIEGGTTVASGPFVAKVEEFLPLDQHQKSATYISDGSKTDYRLKTVTDGNKVSFQAVSHDIVVDEETYLVDGGSVFLVHAVGEDFVEPVPLLKFPLRIGDQYTWKGKLACSDLQLTGMATITTSTGSVAYKGKSQEAIRTDVNLKIGDTANRRLSFWFVKGMGVIKTEMGKNVREPEEQ
ncbi:MAG: hypothetical protein GC165_19180 [Armatimonadetes bacterium]|nr:hypothetical protein [Armatimonadota bacterium]